MKRKVIWLLGLIIVATAIYGIIEYTRGKKDLKLERPELSFDAIDLILLFETDVVSANKKFTDKIISVKGVLSSIDARENPVMLFMKHPERESSVKFSMDSLYASELNKIIVGETLMIKGVCAGGEVLDFELGTDILITNAVVENN